jgi:putative endopeptidase
MYSPQMRKFLFLSLASAALFAACSPKVTDITTPAGKRKFIDPKNMDMNVSPGTDFYQYANGAWLKNTPIPASESRWGSFNQLVEFNQNALKTILDDAMKANAPKGTNLQKIGDFYASGMDSVAIEKAGLAPLRFYLTRIDKVSSMKQLQEEIAIEHTEGISPLVSIGVGQDDKISTEMAVRFWQSGIHLPDRDYFFKDDDRSKKIRVAYDKHIVNTFKLLGEKDAAAKKAAEDILRIEKNLAEASMTRVAMRDPHKTYNKLSFAELKKLAPIYDWAGMFQVMGYPTLDSVIVGQPLFIKAMDKMMREEKLDQWKTYLKWHVTKAAMSYLSSAMVAENFDFSRNFSGQKEMQPRWKRVQGVVDNNLGEVLGQEYVAKNFKPEAKARMMQLIDNLAKTYQKRIEGLDWMSNTTKQKALLKLNSFMKKIGYPDKFTDYSTVNIVRDDYWANLIACSKFEHKKSVAKLGKPVDRTEWGMTPPTVNAYYNPSLNEIVFPAGILQYPFFDNEADDAVNYGGIGAVIGHEMTHGFDDEGRQYDASGNLIGWWTESDAKQFEEKANRIVEQYNAYTVLDTVHVNGKLTLGENLADFGGISLAYEAFKTYSTQATIKTKIDGFTADQRFFLSWAQVWRANSRPEITAQRIITDPHSPGQYRCNGPISNMPEFYQAFGIKPTDKMYRVETDRAKVW